MFDMNGEKRMMPASNEKLYSTAAAIYYLGPEFKYETQFGYDGEIVGNTLNGNLVLIGSGDMSIANRYHDDPLDIFRGFAKDLKDAGISRVKGDVIGDDTCFDETRVNSTWSRGYMQYWYSAEFGGLNLYDNIVEIRVEPGKGVNDPINYSLEPETDYVKVINEAITCNPTERGRLSVERDMDENIIRITGTMQYNTTPDSYERAVVNPALYTTTVLYETLRAEGIEIEGYPVLARDSKYYSQNNVETVSRYFSPPLKRLIAGCNKPSQNLYAELLLRAVGYYVEGEGNNDNSRKLIEDYLEVCGIKKDEINIQDGSGLSRRNLIAPEFTVKLLKDIYKRPYFEDYYKSLPIAGVDGTIRSRMKNSTAQGNVHAKTGYIGFVRTLSGYVTSADGEMFIFSLMFNHYMVPTRNINSIQDNICILLSEFNRGPKMRKFGRIGSR
jgi:D-alanyl-D-alanine carboxypeptidase/D-alanyl-D-alanine-endopeptidase (penicillin-binding protein 4)